MDSPLRFLIDWFCATWNSSPKVTDFLGTSLEKRGLHAFVLVDGYVLGLHVVFYKLPVLAAAAAKGEKLSSTV